MTAQRVPARDGVGDDCISDLCLCTGWMRADVTERTDASCVPWPCLEGTNAAWIFCIRLRRAVATRLARQKGASGETSGDGDLRGHPCTQRKFRLRCVELRAQATTQRRTPKGKRRLRKDVGNVANALALACGSAMLSDVPKPGGWGIDRAAIRP